VSGRSLICLVTSSNAMGSVTTLTDTFVMP
jgi:hypothetical protein